MAWIRPASQCATQRAFRTLNCDGKWDANSSGTVWLKLNKAVTTVYVLLDPNGAPFTGGLGTVARQWQSSIVLREWIHYVKRMFKYNGDTAGFGYAVYAEGHAVCHDTQQDARNASERDFWNNAKRQAAAIIERLAHDAAAGQFPYEDITPENQFVETWRKHEGY